MKALTIWQPWASLIIAGAKPYEFRGWRAPRSIFGQRIVIHAAAKKIDRDEVSHLYHIIVAYADDESEICKNWPEATDIDSEEADEYAFTSLFPKPRWLQGGAA